MLVAIARAISKAFFMAWCVALRSAANRSLRLLGTLRALGLRVWLLRVASSISLQLVEVQFRRGPDVRFENSLHQFKRVLVFFRAARSYAVGGDDQIEIAHIGIVGRKQHADVCRHARENQSFG